MSLVFTSYEQIATSLGFLSYPKNINGFLKTLRNEFKNHTTGYFPVYDFLEGNVQNLFTWYRAPEGHSYWGLKSALRKQDPSKFFIEYYRDGLNRVALQQIFLQDCRINRLPTTRVDEMVNYYVEYFNFTTSPEEFDKRLHTNTEKLKKEFWE